jgi:hypothetical protein
MQGGVLSVVLAQHLFACKLGSGFLEHIQQQDNKGAITEEERIGAMLTSLDIRHVPKSLDPSHKETSNISRGGWGFVHAKDGHGQEVPMFELGIFESKALGFGNGGGYAGDNGDVIRGDPNPRGERGVRESSAEFVVD